MCPSFSLCACRILKMRSCLRSPLAPGSSKDRAILVSSVMFFSFSSAMVIFTYGIVLPGRVSLKSWLILPPCGAHRGAVSGAPPLCLGKVFWFTQEVVTFGIRNLVKHLVHGFLNPGIWTVELARGLRSQLTEHIPVPQSVQCIKHTIRAHCWSISF